MRGEDRSLDRIGMLPRFWYLLFCHGMRALCLFLLKLTIMSRVLKRRPTSAAEEVQKLGGYAAAWENVFPV
jgi:hypothetical protein